jgi:hypothetical protein
MDAHGRVHARTLARRATLGGAAALVPPGKGVGGVLGVLYQSAELVTRAARKADTEGTKKRRGHRGKRVHSWCAAVVCQPPGELVLRRWGARFGRRLQIAIDRAARTPSTAGRVRSG